MFKFFNVVLVPAILTNLLSSFFVCIAFTPVSVYTPSGGERRQSYKIQYRQRNQINRRQQAARQHVLEKLKYLALFNLIIQYQFAYDSAAKSALLVKINEVASWVDGTGNY